MSVSRCSCWTLAPITKRFLDKFKNMREHRERFRALKERAISYVDEIKEEEADPRNKPLDLTTK